MDNRNEVIMFKVGDLVKYKESAVASDSVGLIVKQHPFFKKLWCIRWLDGLEYNENEINLELVKN